MEPPTATYIEKALQQLNEAIQAAAETLGLTKTAGGLKGGQTEWVWYAESPEHWVREVSVSALPRAEQIEVTVRSMYWRTDDRDSAERRLYFGKSYPLADPSADSLAEDLAEPLERAWVEASAAPQPRQT